MFSLSSSPSAVFPRALLVTPGAEGGAEGDEGARSGNGATSGHERGHEGDVDGGDLSVPEGAEVPQLRRSEEKAG